MANVSKLRPAKSPEGASRTALSKALAEAKAAHGRVTKQKQAASRLFAQQMEAEAAIPAAEKAVKKAEAAHVAAVAEAAVLEKPTPVSGVAEAMAALAFKTDRVHTLKAARKVVEDEIPGWEEEALAADTEVERLISEIIADFVQVLLKEARALSQRLAPYKAALMAFARDHSNGPTEWHLQNGFRKSREPLDESADKAWAFFRDLRESEAAAGSPCWKAIRESLRANPNAPLLRPLVAEFDGLLARDGKDENDADVTART
jgi:hypothetical protein